MLPFLQKDAPTINTIQKTFRKKVDDVYANLSYNEIDNFVLTQIINDHSKSAKGFKQSDLISEADTLRFIHQGIKRNKNALEKVKSLTTALREHANPIYEELNIRSDIKEIDFLDPNFERFCKSYESYQCLVKRREILHEDVSTLGAGASHVLGMVFLTIIALPAITAFLTNFFVAAPLVVGYVGLTTYLIYDAEKSQINPLRTQIKKDAIKYANERIEKINKARPALLKKITNKIKGNTSLISEFNSQSVLGHVQDLSSKLRSSKVFKRLRKLSA